MASRLVVGVLAFLGVATVGAQTGPPAAAIHTVAEAEAEGAAYPRVAPSEPSVRSETNEAGAKIFASAPGTAERRCVETDGHPSVRSGDFAAGRFDVRAMMLPDGKRRKLWVVPAHVPPQAVLRIRAGKLNAPGGVSFLEFPPLDNGSVGSFWPIGLSLPEPGRWLLVVTAGPNWGCFLYDEVSR